MAHGYILSYDHGPPCDRLYCHVTMIKAILLDKSTRNSPAVDSDVEEIDELIIDDGHLRGEAGCYHTFTHQELPRREMIPCHPDD